MLTGDKIETATSIAISSGLKTKHDNFYFIREVK
jgi:magnesium-transporting ATPase (P-type)